MFKVFVFDNYDEISAKASEIVLEKLKEKRVVLGMATGSTPEGLYKKLVEAYKKGQSFAHVTTYNLDEYVGLAQDHPQSFYHFMQEKLFKHIDVKAENIHIPLGSGPLEHISADYEALIAKDPQDLQILGLGSNGHIGFNEPGTTFESTVHVVRLKKQTRQDNARFFKDIDEVPTYSITMGIKDILRAKEILVIATGENKAQAVYQMIHGEANVVFPCSALQDHADVVVLLDKEAASLLK